MGDQERSDMLARSSALQRATAADMLPPVDECGAHEFARLMERRQQSQGDAHDDPGPKERNWMRFKLSAFRFAGRLLASDARGAFRLSGDDEPSHAEQDAALAAMSDGRARRRGRALLLRLAASLFRDPVAGELSHELAECVRHADVFAESWQLEVVLSSPELARTLLRLRCDPEALRLLFICPDAQSRALLENNRMLLLTRLGAVSARIVMVNIDTGPIEAEPGAVHEGGGGQ